METELNSWDNICIQDILAFLFYSGMKWKHRVYCSLQCMWLTDMSGCSDLTLISKMFPLSNKNALQTSLRGSSINFFLYKCVSELILKYADDSVMVSLLQANENSHGPVVEHH